ncbi:uncharacterized protein LOC124297613 isoform X2 [Neodiprion virginianus]|uniref:Uncharacterized protein LOC107217825 isoform X1 n=1 Tax=Neodiprion lecontei TaxID=441921 RepID=A0ABM3FGA5_NEOLC|nr:uncharacterized protein LOC107217825 isoform X1 [Neodiprion lecontei]XP_046604781.1 uncharacterized protein LOC124297613 isoform X2 [Neodiprion virginianus]
MNSLLVTLILLVDAGHLIAGRSRYLAIPLDDVKIIELSSGIPSFMPRVARSAEAYVPVAVATLQNEEVEPTPRIERAAAHYLDYVDFGGHTGENGAFGWYADFPAQQ